MTSLIDRIARAVDARAPLFDERHEGAFRLFNGFTEGAPEIVLDVYGKTLVVFDHADGPDGDEATARAAIDAVRAKLPWVDAAVWKARKAASLEARHGQLLYGEPSIVTRSIREEGVRYATPLQLAHDAGFYLDTRALRAWARAHLAKRRVLDTFAYTGSLGIAARAAGASEVVYVDKSRAYLNAAKDSYVLNGWPIRRGDFVAADVFEWSTRARKDGALFDCVFLDPPFFSSTSAGRVDLGAEANRIVNKVRPLVGDGGWLVTVNNALFLSGRDTMSMLEGLCADGYLSIETTLPVPDDVLGLAREGAPAWPTDPAPFNHPTKIAVLRVRRKDGRRASPEE